MTESLVGRLYFTVSSMCGEEWIGELQSRRPDAGVDEFSVR